MTDLEGVSGVVSFSEQTYPDGKYFEQAKLLLTAEVNAAVDGLLETGVEDILIIDGHGPGAMHFESLHPAAKLLHGRPLAGREAQIAYFKKYDVALMLGQHAMAGIPDAGLNHTQNSRTIEYYQLNGKLIGEIAQFALFVGALEIPLIFLSGDQAASREVKELIPGITTAIVKESLSRTYAISYSQTEAHRRIREGVKLAIQRQQKQPLVPLKWPGPFVLEKKFYFSHEADAFQNNPRYQPIDARTVRLESEDILSIIYA
jgi:D-amino peptidase